MSHVYAGVTPVTRLDFRAGGEAVAQPRTGLASAAAENASAA